MANSTETRGPDAPNDPSRKEPAEGSRENVNAYENPDAPGGGISNRPLDQEIDEQTSLPPRGETKRERGDHDA